MRGAGRVATGVESYVVSTSGDYPATMLMHGRFGETELRGNDSYAVTLPMQLSNFLAIRQSQAGQVFCFPSSRVASAGNRLFGARPGCGISIFLRGFAESSGP